MVRLMMGCSLILSVVSAATASHNACAEGKCESSVRGSALLQASIKHHQVLERSEAKCKNWCAPLCTENALCKDSKSWYALCTDASTQNKCGGCAECDDLVEEPDPEEPNPVQGPPWASLQNREMSAAVMQEKMMQKFVLMANDKVSEETLSQFTDLSSSFWQFGLVPGPGAVAWAQKNNKEFIPLIDLKEPVPKKPYGKCSFHKGTCTADKLVEVLEDSKKLVNMTYLMGFNEPHGEHGEGKKSLKHAEPVEAAEWWRTIVQPAAVRTGLELVSPTMGAGGGKGDWGVKFLQECYDNRESEPPCNVELIKTLSVHHFVCYAGFWRKSFAKNGGEDVEMCDTNCQQCAEEVKFPKQDNFYTYFKNKMGEKYGEDVLTSFWEPYFDSVKIWVVPNACGNDVEYNKLTKGNAVRSGAQYCEAITAQSCIHQEGSIKAFLDMDNVDKFSWYVLWMDEPDADGANAAAQRSALMFDTVTGKALPAGRALLGSLNPETADCNGAGVASM